MVKTEDIRVGYIGVDRDIVNEIEEKELTWFGHANKMNEIRLGKKGIRVDATGKKKQRDTRVKSEERCKRINGTTYVLR